MDQELLEPRDHRCGPDRGDAALTAKCATPSLEECWLHEEALTQVGYEYCDKFGEQVDRTGDAGKELAGE